MEAKIALKGRKKVKAKKPKTRNEVETTGIAESQASSNDPVRGPPFN